MARKTITETNTSSSSQTQSQEHSQSQSQQHSQSQSQQQSQQQSQSQSQSTTQKVLDQELLNTILSGLQGMMTDEEITNFAEALLRPQLNAGLEAAQQSYETTKLSKEQEIENLAASLQKGIEEQNRAYQQSMADVETAALSRGMGRSSYTLQNLANQGDALAKAVQQLTDESQRQTSQIQQQITQAAQQNAQTQGRLNADYASQLAAKVEDLRQQQRQEYNQNYLTAVSGSMGSQTTGTQTGSSMTNTTGSSTTDTTGSSTTDTTGSSSTQSSSHSVSVTSSLGGGRGSSSSSKVTVPTRKVAGSYSTSTSR